MILTGQSMPRHGTPTKFIQPQPHDIRGHCSECRSALLDCDLACTLGTLKVFKCHACGSHVQIEAVVR